MLNILCDDLPESVEIDGESFRLTPAFDNVLQLQKQLTNAELSDIDRAELFLYYLTDGAPLRMDLLQAVGELLFDLGDHVKGKQRLFDFEQDADAIFASFWQAYGIDLDAQKGKLHWFKFLALLQNLPEDTAFRKIIDIRARPLPPATKYNVEERAQLMKAKRAVALKISEAERQEQMQEGLRKMALALLNNAERGK